MSNEENIFLEEKITLCPMVAVEYFTSWMKGLKKQVIQMIKSVSKEDYVKF